MASALYLELDEKLDDAFKDYRKLLDDFHKHGDYDVFIILESNLLDLESMALDLKNQDEKFEIIHGIISLRSTIRGLSH